MTTDPHRVTAQWIHGLAASDRRRGDQRRGDSTLLADTDDGLRYVSASAVFKPDAKVRRVLMAREDLVDDVFRSGQSMSAYLRDNAARIAAELNAVLAENGA